MAINKAAVQALIGSADGQPLPANVVLAILADGSGNLLSSSATGSGSATLSSGSLPTLQAQASNGEAFLGGTGMLTLTVAGNVRMLLSNPTGSGKTMYVSKLDVFSSAVGFGELFVNPTVGLPTVLMKSNNVYFGYPTTAVGTLHADTSTTTALSGGVDAGVSIGVGSNALTVYQLPPIIIPAGVSLGIQLPFTGAANASVNAYWWEA